MAYLSLEGEKPTARNPVFADECDTQGFKHSYQEDLCARIIGSHVGPLLSQMNSLKQCDEISQPQPSSSHMSRVTSLSPAPNLITSDKT